jgi:hypothetical protein
MPEFHETMMGQKFYNGQLPELLDQIKRIADSLERLAYPMFQINPDGTYEPVRVFLKPDEVAKILAKRKG